MTAAGWYADPAGRFPHRYWDGNRWTEHVSGPNGPQIDVLPPAPQAHGQQQVQAGSNPQQVVAETQQPAAELGAASAEPTNRPSNDGIYCDPTELHGVLGELGVQPLPPGDGTPFGEPVMILAFSSERPDVLEWWTPAGRLVAFAHIIEKQQPGLDVPGTDPASGAMIGARLSIADANGRPIASTVRTLKAAKPPTYVDLPNGQRLLSVAQDKVFSKIASFTVTAANGVPAGRFVATDARGRAVVLSDAAGRQSATVVKNGKWDSGNVYLEFSRNRPLQMPTEWIASRVASKLLPIKRERVCSVVIRDRRPIDANDALLGFLAPLLMEHTLSLL